MRLVLRIIIWTLALIPPAATTVFGSNLIVTPASLSSYAGQTNIVLQAAGDVIFSGGSLVLPSLPSAGRLTIAAENDIIIQNNTRITAGLGWSVSFLAGNRITLDSGSGIEGVAGRITLNAKTVNQNGFVQVNSAQNHNGFIDIFASDSLNLGEHSQIVAPGDDSVSGSAGGTVTLKAGNNFSDAAGSFIVTAGGANGGNGGCIEISAPNIVSLNSVIDAGAQTGWSCGVFVLDPENIILGASGSTYGGTSGTINGTGNSGTLNVNVNTAFQNINAGQILLEASGNITLNTGTTWDLYASTGYKTSGLLTLEAHGNIVFANGALITDGNDWSVALKAGYNYANNSIQSGVGYIYLNGGNNGTGNGSIETASGSINLEAGNGIQIGSGTVSSSFGNVTWQAGGNLQFGDGSQITDGNNGAVNLEAGYNFANNAVQPGVGYIYLDGGLAGDGIGGSIQTAGGNINLTAGQDITVGAGYVITTGGGAVSTHALAGDIDTGSDAQGYYFVRNARSLNAAYNLQDGLGGISTAAGGNVTLIAGGDVTSVLPVNVGSASNPKIGYDYNGTEYSSLIFGGANADFSTAGSGTYGSQAGNVTIVAGGNVTGHYLVANGTGKIFAGVQMDANGNPETDASGNYLLGTAGSAGTDQINPNLALSLISGGWNVTAAQNIVLQEVRNPNGVFDINGGNAYVHYFNYQTGGYVNLNAGNLVQLGASLSILPRPTGIQIPFVYPPALNITAGAGGVCLIGSTAPFNQLILFPSPQGYSTINTTSGGSLVGSLPAISGAPQFFNLIVSDSGSSQYTSIASFGLNDHAATPVHLNSEMPINLNISGDMDMVLLGAPEAAQINVAGNMNNSCIQGINLAASDATSITVAGDINNSGAFTSVNLSQVAGAQPPNLSVLADAIGSNPSAATLAASFYYDPLTQMLTYQNVPGISLSSLLQELQNLTVQVYSNGIPQWADPPNDTVPLTTMVSVLNAADANALLAQYNVLGVPPYGAPGYSIGGGGQFNITARNLDLGISAGINSYGVGLYSVSGGYPLASLFTKGADINLNLSSNLTMYSSAIASLNGGNIYINAKGDINIGSGVYSITSTGNRGIFSGVPGDISVVAGGNVIVNESRIAAYDGGSLTVSSLNAGVNTGDGGSGIVNAGFFKVDPSTHQVSVWNPAIPGNGILATTFPTDAGQVVGNITVSAAQSILLGCNAVTQTPLNGTSGGAAVITLHAGGQIETIQTLETATNCVAVAGCGTVDLLAGVPPSFLNARVNINDLAAVAGTNVQFTVIAGGIAPLSYQWYKDGTSLSGETSASLYLSDIHRTDAGTYSIVVSNVTGTVTNDIQLHVLVPQLLTASFVQTNHTLSVSFGDADGGLPTTQDIASFVIETSANLVDWTPTNLLISTNASGGLLFQLPASEPGCSFYRVLSQ